MTATSGGFSWRGSGSSACASSALHGKKSAISGSISEDTTGRDRTCAMDSRFSDCTIEHKSVPMWETLNVWMVVKMVTDEGFGGWAGGHCTGIAWSTPEGDVL